MTLLRRGGLAAAFIYLAAMLGLAIFQRDLEYHPTPSMITPAQAGLEQIETLQLKAKDGENSRAWFAQPQSGRPLILYFHGNGGGLELRAARFRKLTGSGYGLLAVAWRGFSGSTGEPTEEGILLDAEAAYAEAVRRGFPPSRIVMMGESLGTGVATIMAARHQAAALVLDAPYTSALAIAEERYPIFPISYLMRDPFRADLAIRNVHMPVLMMHGERDHVIPIGIGRGLFALANEPKRFISVPNVGHIVMGLPQVYPQVEAFIDAYTSPIKRQARSSRGS